MEYEKIIELNGDYFVRFLKKAIGKRIDKKELEYIYVEQDVEGEFLTAVTTDNRRLHIVKLPKEIGITPGYYKVFKASKYGYALIARLTDKETEQFKYVKYKEYLKEKEPLYKTSFKGNLQGELAKLYRGFPEATAFNLKYLRDIGLGLTWDVEWYGPNKPLILKSAVKTAVIMPLII